MNVLLIDDDITEFKILNRGIYKHDVTVHWCSNIIDGQNFINDSGIKFDFVFCDINGTDFLKIGDLPRIEHEKLWFVSSVYPLEKVQNFILKSDLVKFLKKEMNHG